jgi:hypothetical protein
MSVYLINVYLTGVYPMSVYLTGVHLKQACSPHRACISEFQILKILEFLVFGKTSLYPTVPYRKFRLSSSWIRPTFDSMVLTVRSSFRGSRTKG